MEKPREKFFLSWSKSIVRAAKEGGIDQLELDWDGYDKIKEITFKQLQDAIEKEEAEERSKRTFERESKEGEENMVRVAQKRVERKESEGKRSSKERHTENQRKNQKSSVARKLTLKQKLTKIREPKTKELNPLPRKLLQHHLLSIYLLGDECNAVCEEMKSGRLL